MDYSKTVNLPKTDFPMKANLPMREPELLKRWEDEDIYRMSLDKDAPLGKFVLHDGPPYSNGNIHIGHALNKLLKDFVVKYATMKGHRAPYVPGWDNHGMPIENNVAAEFRKKGQRPTKLEIRQACREYAKKWVDIQREQFKRLGIRGDWDNPYLTMAREYEAMIVKVFMELALEGYVYRGLKPIHWCVYDETALAEAEIEYGPHKSPSIYVRFPLRQDPNSIFEGHPTDHSYTVIWTTTPWTIPANMAVAVHPDYEYALVESGEDRYILAAELVERTFTDAGKDYRIIKKIPGKDLSDLVFRHPLFDRDSPVVFADYVTLEDGTGVVHTAPGHGREDFMTGQRYGLEPINPVNEAGYFTEEAGQFVGLHILRQGNEAVTQALRDAGALIAESAIEHSYPHCWRCHNPVVFRTTVQWFMSLDHNGLRERVIEQINQVKWYPEEAINRITAMIANSPDWCLSRQRSWGVGIPVFYCESCNKELMTKESLQSVYELVQREGSDAWFARDASEILPEGTKCPKCGKDKFTKETDILDVWFDSGSSCRAVLEQRPELMGFPATLYLEGSDQHRGWFNKSLIVGTSTKDKSPFEQLVSHGFVLDAAGRKMSKSLGNVISPLDVIKKHGADVLRLWVSSTDYFEDVRVGDEILQRIADAYRRIRNTFRFVLANLYDYDPNTDNLPYGELLEIDRLVLHKLQELVGEVTEAYETYEFHRVFHGVHNFCSVDLSAFYLDILKDRLYASAPKSHERRSAQTVLHELLTVLARLLAPVITYTADEVWQFVPGERTESVQLAEFPVVKKELIDHQLAERWKRILEVRDEVYRAIEQARQNDVIGKPLESRVHISAPPNLYDFLAPYAEQLPSIFIVSQVNLVKSEREGAVTIEVTPPSGEKCERCWLFLESVGQQADHPTLCTRCAGAVSEIELAQE